MPQVHTQAVTAHLERLAHHHRSAHHRHAVTVEAQREASQAEQQARAALVAEVRPDGQ